MGYFTAKVYPQTLSCSPGDISTSPKMAERGKGRLRQTTSITSQAIVYGLALPTKSRVAIFRVQTSPVVVRLKVSKLREHNFRKNGQNTREIAESDDPYTNSNTVVPSYSFPMSLKH